MCEQTDDQIAGLLGPGGCLDETVVFPGEPAFVADYDAAVYCVLWVRYRKLDNFLGMPGFVDGQTVGAQFLRDGKKRRVRSVVTGQRPAIRKIIHPGVSPI